MKNKKTQPEKLDSVSGSSKENSKLESEIPPDEEVVAVKTEVKTSRKTKKPAEDQTIAENIEKPEGEPNRPNISVSDAEIRSPEIDKGENQKTTPKSRLTIIGAVIGGLIAGFLSGYFLLILPLQNQLANITEVNFNGNSSTNIMKSDLSTTKLKQQEMEIRYQAVSDQLMSANQYIFLLRMKEQISFARLMVEQKDGLKARNSLSEIQGHFDHLKPFVIQKDSVAANKIDELIKVSIQHLASDPESVKSDLAEISDMLSKIEMTLFQPEQK